MADMPDESQHETVDEMVRSYAAQFKPKPGPSPAAPPSFADMAKEAEETSLPYLRNENTNLKRQIKTLDSEVQRYTRDLRIMRWYVTLDDATRMRVIEFCRMWAQMEGD